MLQYIGKYRRSVSTCILLVSEIEIEWMLESLESCMIFIERNIKWIKVIISFLASFLSIP